MKQSTKTLLGVAALAVVLVVSGVLYQSLSKNYQPADPPSAQSVPPSDAPEKILAPDFSVEDGDGNAVKLSDFAGGPVVVNVWATWCPYCKAEMAEFDTVWKELGEDVTFMMVNATDGARETKEKAAKYVADQEFSFPVYYDISGELSYTYGISSLPATLFIDKDGYLAAGILGKVSEESLREKIELIYTAEEK